MRALAIGDYDVGGATLIERKTTPDLAVSLRRGRFWRQIGSLRRNARFPVLLIEGSTPEALLGTETMRGLTLAVADQGVVVLRSIDQHDSARWIAGLARRRQARVARDRPPYAQRVRSPCIQPGEALLGAIDGISVHHARALLASFGSVQRIVAAERDDWMAVQGIGPARAQAMALAFGKQPTH
jgi:ERCC4-type nuclease